MTKVTIVVLEVTDDNDKREWWSALKLPPPWRWFESHPDVHVQEVYVKQVVR